MYVNELIRQPRNISETGLPEELIKELLLKHLYDGVMLDILQLRDRLKLSGSIIESILEKFRKDLRVQSHSPINKQSGVRYQLTELGRSDAASALLRSGYIGPAPVSLEQYIQIVKEQTIESEALNRSQIRRAFEKVVIDEKHLDILGPALYSGLPLLIYGQPGTGKTYICKKMAALLGSNIYLPYAISVDREVIQYFDPLIHTPITEAEVEDPVTLSAQSDPRFLKCKRPVAISGGELTMDRLEVNYDPVARTSYAPIQLKANNGIYIIDDMGRQRMPPMELFNRWIVPMEERKDFLTLATGKHFEVPFSCVLIFSTNLHPTDLADEAFLRRLGYKIHFSPIDQQQFKEIWQDQIKERMVETVEPEVLTTLFEKFNETKRELLPCHPRDLMRIALDIAAYMNQKGVIDRKNILLAWDTYFVNLKVN